MKDRTLPTITRGATGSSNHIGTMAVHVGVWIITAGVYVGSGTATALGVLGTYFIASGVAIQKTSDS